MMDARNTAILPPLLEVDEATVHKFVSLIHEQAARALRDVARPGFLQLTRLHPLDNKLVPTRFQIGDVDGMVQQAIADASAGHNVYIEGRTIGEPTPRGARGRIEHTAFVFALVDDSDADKGKAANRDLGGLASLVVETSPGNGHNWFFLKEAVSAVDAKPIGEAMRASLESDSDTGTVTQPYRVAGTPNYPSKAKQKRGRTMVERTSIVDAQPERSYTLEELGSLFSSPTRNGARGKRGSNSKAPEDFRTLLDCTDAAAYGSDRSRLLFAALRGAILAGLDDTAIIKNFLDPCYTGKAINQHCQDHGKTDSGAHEYLARQIERARKKIYEFEEYFEKDGSIFWKKLGKDAVRLSNFTAAIIEDLKIDDGSEQVKRQFTIKYTVAGRQSIARIPADQFDSLNWVTRELGSDACITPGPQIRSHLANAIKSMDYDSRMRDTAYAHLGWRKIEGRWLYLHADGAIGTSGPVEGIRVELNGELSRFTLPTAPVADPLSAIGTSLRMLDMAPGRITWPLLGATYLAPLGEFVPITVTLFFTGGTGTRKSAMQAIAQGHWYWEQDGKKSPANWSSTANSLEALAFRAKDALLVIDDFCPKGAVSDVQRYHQTAERIIRAQGNHAGRGRMNADGSLRTEMHPRGLLAGSGEDTPSGHSLRARNMICEISASDVDLQVLTEMQRAAGESVLKVAMASYVRFVATQDKGSFKRRLSELRAEATKKVSGGHTRTPENAALLMLGVETLLAHAVSIGADIDIEKMRREAWEALLTVGQEQDRHQRDEQPAERVMTLLQGLLSSGRAHIRNARSDHPPKDARMLGWTEKEYNDRLVLHPGGHSIGWIDADDLFLDPSATYAEIQQFAQKQGQPLALTQGALWRRLREAGLLEPGDEGRHTTKKSIGGQRLRVLHLKMIKVLEIETATDARRHEEVL
ncbi:DNA-primase RepB domain-containing protein [Bradyrhizobium sp. JYMT SZCCT0180]|uniref:DNA-primase RepB domain-containing protein n=1 Tax=Bradyrhizobium sp. JYMT SZCCT0180 TaxID=2807666 RepID=UPI001BADE33C|nr:DNA-primase RepB domain-containing protein [Bradyrhizobium sp. JYMT SZCCT0180]MBR1211332.1 DUF927 domain-containing protein [Bradyrhizobium sp. JYMT SZCCT0180]